MKETAFALCLDKHCRSRTASTSFIAIMLSVNRLSTCTLPHLSCVSRVFISKAPGSSPVRGEPACAKRVATHPDLGSYGIKKYYPPTTPTTNRPHTPDKVDDVARAALQDHAHAALTCLPLTRRMGTSRALSIASASLGPSLGSENCTSFEVRTL